jgi:TubC N-terminal docking domain
MGAIDLLNELAYAGLSVIVDGGNLVIRPRELLTDDMRAAVKALKPDLVELLQTAPINDCRTVQNRTCDAREATVALLRRLRGVGLDRDAADQVASWAQGRDGDADDRRLCIECAHFGERGKVCRHPELIAIQAPRDLGRLATTPQRCGGLKEAAP